MAKNDQGRAFVAFSHDAGTSFGPPVRVDDAGSLGRLGVAMLDDGSAAVTWVETAKPRSQLRLRIVKPGGERSAPLTISDTAGGERYPRAAHIGNDVLLAWTEGSDKSSQVRTARLKLPGK
jgi:hypothetical protein